MAAAQVDEIFKDILETIREPLLVLDSDLKVISVNRIFYDFFKVKPEETVGQLVYDLDNKQWDIPKFRELLETILPEKGTADNVEVEHDFATIGKRNLLLNARQIIQGMGKKPVILLAIEEITERRQAEKFFRESQEKLHSILDNIGIGVALISPTMEILELNRQMRVWFPDIDPSRPSICYQAFNNPPREEICDYCPTCRTLQDGNVHEAMTVLPTADGPRNYRIVSSPLLDQKGKVTAAIEMVDDVTELISLEAQLHQAQKMESVGRLAGGVAHDYNNALSVILGFTELAMDALDPAEPAQEDLNEVLKAAKRAADITRQLLAFARKQTISPRVLNLNKNVESMLKMVQRLIGEDIDLVWLPGENLSPVKMDPSQIDQILVNLCVNARDAIPEVGRITIETEQVAFDTAYCADHHGFIPGRFVMLAFSDNGCGMDKEILDTIFEPFFTTKDMDKGTGLGLSTVYGIVKQNKGFINVYSEPGEGTAIKIYLPQYEDNTLNIQWQDTRDIPSGHGETIMVVEDDPSILKFVKKILNDLGYTVLTATSPKMAMERVTGHAGKIHLLLTDVIMPEMNGFELIKRIEPLSPDFKHVFMSGYTSDAVARYGVLDEGVHFIQKPFSKKDLAKIVRKALDEIPGAVQE